MMMNALSQVSKDTDIGKQMAYMRNYINQLRDEIENDLMNIGYNNLDADLRKRFDDMQTGLLTANNTSMEVAGLLKTQYLKANEIVSTYATIGSLNAATARIGSLEADHVSVNSFNALSATVGTISADYVTANQLSAVNAKFNNLNADNITSGHISTDRIDFSTAITSNMAVESTILVGFKRYQEGTSDVYLEISRNGLVFNKRNNPSRLLDYAKMATL